MNTRELARRVARILEEETGVSLQYAVECANNAVAGWDATDPTSDLAGVVLGSVAYRRMLPAVYPVWCEAIAGDAARRCVILEAEYRFANARDSWVPK